MNTLIVIPCYNHNDLCNSLLLNIKKHQILIIDDGSDIKFELDVPINNCIIQRNNTNKGKGYAIKLSAEYAIKNNFTHILVIDADMQHDPSKIDSFINNNYNFDLVYGKREFNSNMPYLRRLSNSITSFIISIYCKKSIKDSQCGYRLYNLDLFNNLKSDEDGYQFETEILLKKIDKSSNIKFVNIPTIYNKSHSYIHNFADTYKFIKLIVRNIIR